MRIVPAFIPGIAMIGLDPVEDERGSFARSFCAETFRKHGLSPVVAQCSISRNRHKGTLRGLHYQAAPHGEPKLVRCTRGRIFDVAVDLRPQSPTYCRWFGAELDAAEGAGMYIPVGCAHGFLTLEDDSEIFYQMGEPYVPEAARGVRWNDPAFAIAWPASPDFISERDAGCSDFYP